MENPVKWMKTLTFCRKNGLVMQNHGLGIHRDKIWADNNNLKYPKIPHNLFGWSAQSAKIFGILEKKTAHWVSLVHGCSDGLTSEMWAPFFFWPVFPRPILQLDV